MRVLVTGSCGRIGSMQTEMALKAGYEIRSTDRVAQKKSDEWEHIPGDLRDLDTIRRLVQNMDAVIHLGAIPHDSAGKPEEILDVNIQGTYNILLACLEAGVGRIVFYSSVNALGCVGGHRMAEYLPIDDNYPRHPMSNYQLSKHLGEEACRAYSARHGIVTICLRPVYVVTDSTHYQKMRENTNPERGRWEKNEYFAYVDGGDVCEAAMLGLTVKNIRHGAFLLTADDTTMSESTAELTTQYYPDTHWKQEKNAYLTDNPHRSLFDCSNAKDVLGWQPKISWRKPS